MSLLKRKRHWSFFIHCFLKLFYAFLGSAYSFNHKSVTIRSVTDFLRLLSRCVGDENEKGLIKI